MRQSIFLLPFLVLSILITSCSEDDNTAAPNSGIEGEWKMTAYTYNSTSTTTFEELNLTVLGKGTAKDITYTIDFDNGTFTSKGGYTLSLIAKDQDDNVLLDSDYVYDDVNSTGSYSVDGNILTINGTLVAYEVDGTNQNEVQNEQMVEFEINDNGELVFEVSEQSTTSMDGVLNTIDVSGTVVFVRN